MAKKKRPYRGPQSVRDAAAMERAVEAVRRNPTAANMDRVMATPGPVRLGSSSRPSSPVRRTPVNTEPPAPAATLESARTAAPKVRRGWGGRYLIPAAIGTAAVGGGALAYRHHRRKNVKKLYDPFTGTEVEFGKAGYGGAGLPDRVYGASTPMIGQTRSVGALLPTGKHVSHENKLERHTPLSGYRRTPSGAKSTRLLQVKGGKDRASREYQGKVEVASKADTPRLALADVDRLNTYSRQAGRRGARIA